MHKYKSLISGVVGFIAIAVLSHAACIPQNLASPSPRDPVARVLALQKACPQNAMEFVTALKQFGAGMEPTMVNFVGFHNPDPGAFFIFEIVSGGGAPPSDFTILRGDLFFGHFTSATNDGRLVSNQLGLEIELIAWDPDKQFFNFYELVNGAWFYRGDSKDILDDIQLLHRQRNGLANPFGNRLRCSGCHVNGGLLQKELTAPHNDWFVQTRPLPLGVLRPDAFVAGKFADLKDASDLSKLVIASAQRLADSPGYRKVVAAHSMQEQLRPLFCPVELNIESDSAPFDEHKPTLSIPSGFFVDPRLAVADVSVKRQDYDEALQTLHSRLPQSNGRQDADHAWLAPAKAQSDIVAIDALIAQGIVDQEFASDVLAVDFTNPVFSEVRCDMLKLVPDKGGSDFLTRFQIALRGATGSGPVQLLDNLTDPRRNAAFHENQALAFLTNCKQHASEPSVVLDWLRLLAQRRAEVSASEISLNPKGHILENPNRIVFPSVQPQSVAKSIALTPACQIRQDESASLAQH